MLNQLFRRWRAPGPTPDTRPSPGIPDKADDNPAPANRYYTRVLDAEQIAHKEHRGFVGGMWDKIGPLQLDFMKERGLQPHHDFLDVGCGALRGGIHFIRYLDSSRYYGLDLNPSLLEAGRAELEEANLLQKKPELACSDKFEVSRFGVAFDYAVAVSVFTHLPLNHIVRCLTRVQAALKPTGEFYATFFEAPFSAHLEPINQWGKISTHYDSDPFHYSFSEMEWAAGICGLRVELIGEWEHPRNQRMLLFRR